jgi:hypothetical protein
MDVLGDLVARNRRGDAPALRHAPSGRASDYRRFCTTTWKVGNLLRNEGVRDGATVGIAARPEPEPVLSLFGVALLGATVRLDPPDDADGLKALVGPTDTLDEYDPGPGTRLVAYGPEPDDPAVSHFERDVWSENPTEPPDIVAPDDAMLATGEGSHTHRALLNAARAAVEAWDLTAEDAVAVRSSLAHPGTVAAGVVAPLLVGGEMLFPDEGTTGDIAVVTGDAPEPSVAPGAVLGER